MQLWTEIFLCILAFLVTGTSILVAVLKFKIFDSLAINLFLSDIIIAFIFLDFSGKQFHQHRTDNFVFFYLAVSSFFILFIVIFRLCCQCSHRCLCYSCKQSENPDLNNIYNDSIWC